MARRRRLRTTTITVLALVTGISVYAVTASNTVPTTRAGSGAGAISGYTVSSVVYNLNASTPSNIDSVTFSISPTTTTTVKAQLVSGGSWYSCTNSSGTVTCTTTSPQATVAAADQLSVIAVG